MFKAVVNMFAMRSASGQPCAVSGNLLQSADQKIVKDGVSQIPQISRTLLYKINSQTRLLQVLGNKN
jgi:hypothetical protein